MDSLIESLARLPDSAEMRAWDGAAIEFGIPEIMLMENAAEAIYAAAREKYGDFSGRRVWVFMGGGNNGGDAAALARLLLDANAMPRVFCLKAMADLAGAAAWHADLAAKAGVGFERLPGHSLGDLALSLASERDAFPDLAVDGLLGTGFSGTLRREMAELVESLNALSRLAGCPILAIDVPSGLNAATGLPQPVAVRADCTITLAAAKPGLVLPQAREYAGTVICRQIGIPKRVSDACPSVMRLLDGKALEFEPEALANSYKNIYGHVIVAGGAERYAGACHLACAAALREGGGLVTACAPAASLAAIRMGWPEIMTFAAGPGASWPESLPADAQAALSRASALVIGPGMGRDPQAAAFLASLLDLPGRAPAVIDADALCLLAKNPALLAKLTAKDIITPHPGEAAMLLDCPGSIVQADRKKALAGLCGLSEAAVVLKGAGTLLGRRGEPVLLCPYDIPGLAIGGAGDTLSGCIGAILGSLAYRSCSTLAKAALGVITHAMAGLSLSREYPDRGFTASQLADALPFARAFARGAQKPLPGIVPWPQC